MKLFVQRVSVGQRCPVCGGIAHPTIFGPWENSCPDGIVCAAAPLPGTWTSVFEYEPTAEDEYGNFITSLQRVSSQEEAEELFPVLQRKAEAAIASNFGGDW